MRIVASWRSLEDLVTASGVLPFDRRDYQILASVAAITRPSELVTRVIRATITALALVYHADELMVQYE